LALDRQAIEKKDFPIGRRGYAPEAVDAHLSAVAGEVEELKRTARQRTESLATAASEQVRAIVEAAETSAAEIQRQAEDEAGEIRAEASGEARSTREQTTAEARDYVGRVSESTAVMLERIEAMQNELNALFESLRTGSNRLNADLQLLEGNLEEVRDAVVPRPVFEPEPASVAASPAPPSVPSPTSPLTAPPDLIASEPTAPPPDEPASGPGPAATAPGPAATAPGPAEPPPEEPSGADESEGARLIALNMALNGTPREETDRYLAENFKLSDRRGLLDEVYESVGS
jgi:cell division septum initiation protein DivIVA